MVFKTGLYVKPCFGVIVELGFTEFGRHELDCNRWYRVLHKFDIPFTQKWGLEDVENGTIYSVTIGLCKDGFFRTVSSAELAKRRIKNEV